MTTATQEVELSKAQAQFAMTPVGQSIKQFEMVQRMATMYSSSNIVPATYQGNIGNCAIALDMAIRMGVNPLMVMQNLYIVHGMPSFSSKFLIATINASGRYTPLQYEFVGETGTNEFGCRVVAYARDDRERTTPLYGDLITLQMAKAEGWATKNGSKWMTMPSQMLRYRAAAFWQRVYCPEISMGFISTEEAYDAEDVSYEDVSAGKTASNTIAKISELAAEATGGDSKRKGDGINTPLV